MHRTDIERDYTESDKAPTPEPIEILSNTHNIISIRPEVVPERLQGCTHIHYLPEQDMIVIAGWKEMTALIGELIVEYLKVSPYQHNLALETLECMDWSENSLKIWQALEKLYQIRKQRMVELMKIDDIKIFPYYRDNPPKKEKFQRKVWYYAKNNRFESEIVVDRFGRLIDGYTSYLIARAYGLDEVPVRYARKEVIKAVYRPGGKEYRWKLPLNLSGRISVGDRVKVQTSSGPQKVIVTAVEEYGTQRPEPRCRVLRLCQKGGTA